MNAFGIYSLISLVEWECGLAYGTCCRPSGFEEGRSFLKAFCLTECIICFSSGCW